MRREQHPKDQTRARPPAPAKAHSPIPIMYTAPGPRPMTALLALSALAALTAGACDEPDGPEALPTEPAVPPPPTRTTALDAADAQITEAVELRFALDRWLPAHRVEVSTRRGVVTLTGSVAHLLARDRALELSHSTRGVRAVVDRLKVTPRFRPDDELKHDINMALTDNAVTEKLEVIVGVEGGRVTLDGRVDSQQERRTAERVARRVRGVAEVDNRIEVAYRTDRPDEEIREDVRSRLRADVRVYAPTITTEVNDGQVSLSGTVGSSAERLLVESLAWVAGTRSVNTEDLDVVWVEDSARKHEIPFRSDGELKLAVRDALTADPRVSPFDLDVEVTAGEVALRGEVSTLAARRAAEEDAQNTVGVVAVKSEIRVATPTGLERREIQAALKRRFERHPVLSRYDLAVLFNAGTAHLTGVVPYAHDRQAADRAAAHVRGVQRVNNGIVVNSPAYPRSDFEIRHDVATQLRLSPLVDADGIEVSVTDGVVTLKGEVASWAEWRQAARNARQGGARRVENELTISRSGA